MIRRPPRSTQSRSSAASDVYKRQGSRKYYKDIIGDIVGTLQADDISQLNKSLDDVYPVSYTHLRAHETVLDLVCRLLLEKKKQTKKTTQIKSD